MPEREDTGDIVSAVKVVAESAFTGTAREKGEKASFLTAGEGRRKRMRAINLDEIDQLIDRVLSKVHFFDM